MRPHVHMHLLFYHISHCEIAKKKWHKKIFFFLSSKRKQRTDHNVHCAVCSSIQSLHSVCSWLWLEATVFSARIKAVSIVFHQIWLRQPSKGPVKWHKYINNDRFYCRHTLFQHDFSCTWNSFSVHCMCCHERFYGNINSKSVATCTTFRSYLLKISNFHRGWLHPSERNVLLKKKWNHRKLSIKLNRDFDYFNTLQLSDKCRLSKFVRPIDMFSLE